MDNTLITQDRLDEIVRFAGMAPSIGMFAEVGVYKGGSLKELAMHFPGRKIVGFDTFAGLPHEQWQEGEPHSAGEFSDTDIESVSKFINMPNVELVKGLFPESADFFYDSVPYAFVHIDTDFELSVKACIEWFWPRLLAGAFIIFDDFDWPNCPGVRKAIEESGLPYELTQANYQAYIHKPL